MIRYQGWDAAFFDALLDGYPLHLAASHGDVPEIHRLLDTGYNINELHLPRSNQMGFGSALHIAVWCDQTAAFAALLERGANMDILDERTPDERKVEDTPIRLAVRLGRRDMVRKMWRSGAQRHMYAKTSNLADRVTLLEVAAREGYPDIVGDMLSWKSDWTYDQRLNALRKACRAYDVDADAGCTRLLLNDWQYDPEDLEEIACETIIHRVEVEDWYDSVEEMQAAERRRGGGIWQKSLQRFSTSTVVKSWAIIMLTKTFLTFYFQEPQLVSPR